MWMLAFESSQKVTIKAIPASKKKAATDLTIGIGYVPYFE